MRVNLPTNEPFSVKRGLNTFAKYIDLDQPAQPAQSGLSLIILLLVNFLHI